MLLLVCPLLCSLLLLLSVFLHPKKSILVKTLVHYCFLVFRLIGEYISLDLFYFVNLTSSCSLIPWFSCVPSHWRVHFPRSVLPTHPMSSPRMPPLFFLCRRQSHSTPSFWWLYSLAVRSLCRKNPVSDPSCTIPPSVSSSSSSPP